MTVYQLTQHRGSLDVEDLLFLSKREAVNHALYLVRVHGKDLDLERHPDGNFVIARLDMPLRLDRLLFKAVLYNSRGLPAVEMEVKPGGFLDMGDLRPASSVMAA